MKIVQGEIYWVNFSPSTGSELSDMHPALVLQTTLINATRINTVVVTGITSNMKLAKIPGNVVLRKKDIPGLTHDSVVNVSQLFTIDKSRLEGRIGIVSGQMLEEVFGGIDWLFGRRRGMGNW